MPRSSRWRWIAGLLASGLLAGALTAAAKATTHQGLGVLRELKDHGKLLVIQHHAIPGFMPAMTMSFELADPGLARGLRVGDTIRFTLTRKGDFWPITAIRRVPPAPEKRRTAPPAPAAVAGRG